MSEDLKPYKVEVDDHSDDCGTVYRLTGPNMSLTSKHEQDLQDRADDLNLGFEAGRAPLPRKEWEPSYRIIATFSDVFDKNGCKLRDDERFVF